MGDVFKEQLVKRARSSQDTLKNVGIIVAVIVIVILASIFMSSIVFFVLFGAGYGAYWLMGRQNKEFEYIFTSGELDIDCIINRTSRKRVFSGYVRDFEILTYADNKDYERMFLNAELTLDFSAGRVSEVTYAAYVVYKGRKTKLIFDPSEMMLDAIATSITPRKFIRKK